jgi:hypothetical protein
LLPWRVIRTVVLPILPGGPFYVCKVVLVFVGKQPPGSWPSISPGTTARALYLTSTIPKRARSYGITS